jgi:hypothetical protein
MGVARKRIAHSYHGREVGFERNTSSYAW